MATRIEQLAQPKPDLLGYPDRRSVYWLDELAKERTDSTTTFELTPRWSQLCRGKKLHGDVEQIRVSPIWVVSEGALKALPSDRLCSLARPRLPVAGWQPSRPLLAPVGRAVLNAVATPRICLLAQPKTKLGLEGTIHESRTASASHRPAKASPRIELLATPKQSHPKYVGQRPASWPVPRAVRETVASERVRELSHPKERKALFEGYNPYIISRAAVSASPSSRLHQLCLPLPRKCRTR